MGNREEGNRKSVTNSEKRARHAGAKSRTPGSHPTRGKDTTFLTQEQALHNVRPILNYVAQLVRRGQYATVPGWLNRLGMWLIRMERGNKHDARTPFFLRMSYEQIAKSIMKIVVAGERTKSRYYRPFSDFYGDLVEVEAHQSDKIGSRGVFPPSHIWLPEKVEKVWCDKPPLPSLDKEALKRSLEWLSNLRPKGEIDVNESSIEEGFKTAGTEDQDEKSLNVDTNSCFPTYVRHWYHKVWDSSVSLVQRMVQTLLTTQTRLLWKKLLRAKSWQECRLHFVATANQRTNVASGWKATEENTYQGIIMSKLRFVCAMPKWDTILGKPILNRLMESCRKIENPDGTHPFCALMRPEVIDKNMQVCLKTAHDHRLIPLGTDFSGYDETVPPWLAFEVARAVAKWMTPRCANIFLGLVWSAFYQTSCITPTKFYGEGPSSMKSGSWLTNIMDSLINIVSQRYGYEAGFYKSILNHFVQGDDAILLGEGVTPENFEKCVATLGFVGNASKQYYKANSVSFCQKVHVLGFPGGIYPIARATAACVSLEDDVGIETDEAGQFPYVLAFRTVCRLGTACFNPNFVELVNLFAAEDKIHLGKDMPAKQLASLAGSYATKFRREWIDKPWKRVANSSAGFSEFPVNRVLRGELPPPPGNLLFKWVYGVRYEDVPDRKSVV